MLSFNIKGALLTLSAFFLPLVQAQFVSSLPKCVQTCINQSQDDNCAVTDVGCLCRASAGNFLPDLITCMHGECDNSLDNNLLLTPLQLACTIAGAPIPASAIRNAENVASSLASQVTTTVTMGGSSATGSSEATTTVDSVSVSVSTTTVTTIQGGTTLAIVFPVTIEQTTTVSGSGSTVTSMASPSNGFTGLIPVIVVSTDSAGSIYTSINTQPGAISTYTTTDSRGSTTTETSTYTSTAIAAGQVIITTNSAGSTFTTIQSPSSSASSSGGAAGVGGAGSISDTSLTTTTTSLAADKTSSSGLALSKTSSASNEDATNSSPYKDTNNSATREGVSNWLGLSILLAVGIVWF